MNLLTGASLLALAKSIYYNWYLQKKKTMWFIGVEVAQETSAPPPKKNPECCQIQCGVIHRA